MKPHRDLALPFGLTQRTFAKRLRVDPANNYIGSHRVVIPGCSLDNEYSDLNLCTLIVESSPKWRSLITEIVQGKGNTIVSFQHPNQTALFLENLGSEKHLISFISLTKEGWETGLPGLDLCYLLKNRDHPYNSATIALIEKDLAAIISQEEEKNNLDPYCGLSGYYRRTKKYINSLHYKPTKKAPTRGIWTDGLECEWGNLVQVFREYNRLGIDPATGLLNHAKIMQHLDDLIRRDRKFHALMLDVNNFGIFNETYGHPGGDDALFKIGQDVKMHIRGGDFAGRKGEGDELLLLLPGINADNSIDLQTIATRIFKAIREPFNVFHSQKAEKVAVSVSIGGTMHLPGESKTSFMARLDGLLYEAKKKFRKNEDGKGTETDAIALE
jgi:diguanylate cyclase (GGDEF)-like protein